ncbi:MAG: phytanoyl-CoA dioxygenase family protein [Pseudomonadota bacterium]
MSNPSQQALKAAYDRDGYVVIPELLIAADIAELKAEAAAICRGQRGDVRGIVPVPDSASDDDAMGRYLTVQFPHKASDLIRNKFVAHPRFAEALSAVIGPDVKCMQSMLFIKPAGKPGQGWHQDEHFIPTRDRSLCGLWLAIDDATEENGCLWVRPGSHRDGILYDTAPHGSDQFDEGHALVGTPDDADEGVVVEIPAGGAILFNGYLHHRSLPNRAAEGTYRRSLVNHYMSAQSLLPWDWDGRLPPTRDMRDIVMVCGKDPYAWKGTDDLTKPFLRAETSAEDDPNRDAAKQVF